MISPNRDINPQLLYSRFREYQKEKRKEDHTSQNMRNSALKFFLQKCLLLEMTRKLYP